MPVSGRIFQKLKKKMGRYHHDRDGNRPADRRFAYREKYYTGWTFLLTGFFICCIYMYRGYFKGFDAVSFPVSTGLPGTLFLS